MPVVLHIAVVGSAAPFWDFPTNEFFGGFYGAGFAVNTILMVDLQPEIALLVL